MPKGSRIVLGKRIPPPNTPRTIGCNSRWNRGSNSGLAFEYLGLAPDPTPTSTYCDNLIFKFWFNVNMVTLSSTYAIIKHDVNLSFEEFYTGIYNSNHINDLHN